MLHHERGGHRPFTSSIIATASNSPRYFRALALRRTHRCQPETPNVWGRSRTAAGSLKAVFESSDVERSGRELRTCLAGETEEVSLLAPVVRQVSRHSIHPTGSA